MITKQILQQVITRLNSQVNPTYKWAGKAFDFIHIHQMVLPVYLGHYVQKSVQEKYPATSEYGHTYEKHAAA
jgi:hypothetical protein